MDSFLQKRRGRPRPEQDAGHIPDPSSSWGKQGSVLTENALSLENIVMLGSITMVSGFNAHVTPQI